MKIVFKSTVEQGPCEGLSILIERKEALYGSLMRVYIQVSGCKEWYKVTPSDLTTHLLVPLPPELVLKLGVQAGQDIEGHLEAKEYKSPAIPPDVKQALERSDLDMSGLSIRQQRQGLLFIAETHDQEIRRQRIDKFVEACRVASGKN